MSAIRQFLKQPILHNHRKRKETKSNHHRPNHLATKSHSSISHLLTLHHASQDAKSENLLRPAIDPIPESRRSGMHRVSRVCAWGGIPSSKQTFAAVRNRTMEWRNDPSMMVLGLRIADWSRYGSAPEFWAICGYAWWLRWELGLRRVIGLRGEIACSRYYCCMPYLGGKRSQDMIEIIVKSKDRKQNINLKDCY